MWLSLIYIGFASPRSRVSQGAASNAIMQLARMFVSMPDHEYRIVAGGIPAGRDTLAKCRTRMLCQMRRAQWPGTKCATPENVRFYYYLERHK